MIRDRILRRARTGLVACVIAGLTAGCASPARPSQQLVDARRVYAAAAASRAPALAPSTLLDARRSLAAAEQAFHDSPGSPREQQLAYVAQRQAQLAIARAGARAAKRARDRDRAAYAAVLERQATAAGDELAATERELARTREELARRGDELARQGQQLDERSRLLRQREAELEARTQELRASRDVRAQVERERDEALDELREIAEIRETERGTIITLGGTVLFPTNESTLLPIARQRLDRVAAALQRLADGRALVIEGHTDDRGSADFNRRLSAARAETVRAYLVSRGVPPDLLVAVGKGEDQPVASNESPEGRANNRRVEIVIGPPTAASLR